MTGGSKIDVIYRSEWLMVDQSMIDRFADTTFDRQFIHVDPVRAADTPFGGTVAHGFLTLSLLPHLYEAAQTPQPDAVMVVNYGLDRVRFILCTKVSGSAASLPRRRLQRSAQGNSSSAMKSSSRSKASTNLLWSQRGSLNSSFEIAFQEPTLCVTSSG